MVDQRVPHDAVEIRDGYVSNQMLVTFRPSIVESAAPETLSTASALAIDEAPYRDFAERIERFGASVGFTAIGSTLAVDSVAPGARVDGSAGSVLSDLERTGLISNAVPLRRPRSGEVMLNELLPRGGGRTMAAAAEAFAAVGERPSDQLLQGAVLVSMRSAADADQVHAQLLADAEHVVSVERVPVRRLQQVSSAINLDPVAPWHIERIGLNRARAVAGFDWADQVRVAVLDTGIDADHPLLKNAIDLYSYDPPLAGVTSGSRDIIGHGTHVAGTIAAIGTPGDIEGVSRARLHIHKIFDDDVDSTSYYQQVGGEIIVVDDHFVNEVMYMRALAACVDNNYEVINLSIGGRQIGHSREQAHFRRMIDQGQIVVAAMGNERREGSPTSWPAAYPGVLAVGALDLNDGVAPFSNGGSHICVTAPGVDILATMPTYRGVESWTGKRDATGAIVRDKPVHWTTYRSTMRGTSMASPQVAGAAALWVAKYGRNLANFRNRLESSARKVGLMADVIPHVDYGHGCLDVESLLR